MEWLRIFASRFFGVFRRRALDAELDAELRAHLDALREEKIRQGMNEEEARHAARREFGGLEQAKETYRDQRILPFFETLAQDLRYASRMLVKNPGFTTVTILTLALGIGANTGLFSLVNSVLLGSLPVRNPQELVIVKYTDARTQESAEDFSYPMYQAMRDKNTVFANVLTRSGVDFNASYGGQSERAVGEMVSGNYFETLAVLPFLGRLIGPEDDRTPGAHPVAVLSYGYWQRRFGSDPLIVGKDIILNDHPIRVIGITPPRFYGTELARNPDIRVPMMMAIVFRPVPANRLQNPRHRWMTILARRKPEVSVAQAQASLDILYHQILAAELQELGESINAHDKERALASRIQLDPGDQGFAHLRGEMERPLLLMFAVTGIVLLVACANLANLLLARNAKRKQEILVRLAIGAGRGRLVRQWLTESLLLSALGGCAGVVVAYWAKTALLGFLPSVFTANLHAPMDLRVSHLRVLCVATYRFAFWAGSGIATFANRRLHRVAQRRSFHCIWRTPLQFAQRAHFCAGSAFSAAPHWRRAISSQFAQSSRSQHRLRKGKRFSRHAQPCDEWLSTRKNQIALRRSARACPRAPRRSRRELDHQFRHFRRLGSGGRQGRRLPARS